MKKILLLNILFFFTIISISAQTLNQFSMRNYDVMVFNPAIAGSKLNHEFILHHRSQWIDFKDAPSSQYLSYNGNVSKNMGLGAYFFNDVAGPFNNMKFNIAYAYHLAFSKFNISMGVSGSVSKYRIDTDNFNSYHKQDMLINNEMIFSAFIPDATAGLYIYNKKFHVGVSVTDMIKSKLKNDLNTIIPSTQHYYLTGGYNFEINSQLNILPDIIATTDGKTYIAESGLTAIFSNKFLCGVKYRTTNDITTHIGIKLYNKLFVAYSYDFSIIKLNTYTLGSHEIIISFVLPKNRKSIRPANQNQYNSNRRSYWN